MPGGAALGMAGAGGRSPARARADRDRPTDDCTPRRRLVAGRGTVLALASRRGPDALRRRSSPGPEDARSPRAVRAESASRPRRVRDGADRQGHRGAPPPLGDVLRAATAPAALPRRPGCSPPAFAAARSSHPQRPPATRRCRSSAGAVPSAANLDARGLAPICAACEAARDDRHHRVPGDGDHAGRCGRRRARRTSASISSARRPGAARIEHVGTWQMTWRRTAGGAGNWSNGRRPST